MIINPKNESIRSIYPLLRHWQLVGNTILQTCYMSSLNIWNQHFHFDPSTGQDMKICTMLLHFPHPHCSLFPPHCSETRALQSNGTQAPDLGNERLGRCSMSFYKAKYFPFKELSFLFLRICPSGCFGV